LFAKGAKSGPSVREGSMAAKVMGLLRRPDGLRLRDSSVQPFVLADMGTAYLQQTTHRSPASIAE
jgi:hypothetical protein